MAEALIRPEVLPSYTYEVGTPDGTLFLTIAEYGDKPREVQIYIGKSGTTIRAWCGAMERLISFALVEGVPLLKIIEQISGHTSFRSIKQISGVNIRSGPEGVAYGLMLHIQQKRKERNEPEEVDYGNFFES